MGGDHGPRVTLAACRAFPRTPRRGARCCWSARPTAWPASRIRAPRIVPASEVVGMDDPIEVALRKKKDSSMRVAIQQVKDGAAQAAVSAGNTGALMAIARYLLKTLDGIDRPAIATQLPNAKGGATTVLDLGANVDCDCRRPAAVRRAGLGPGVGADRQRDRPRSACSTSAKKRSRAAKRSRRRANCCERRPTRSDLNFYGNVEGNDIFKGTTDIVVCDGFVGNVTLEGQRRRGFDDRRLPAAGVFHATF